MSKQHQQQKEVKTHLKRKPQLVCTDMPVKISILHNAESLKEYEDVIPVEFDPKTPKGNENAYRLQWLKKVGVLTETRCLKLPASR